MNGNQLKTELNAVDPAENKIQPQGDYFWMSWELHFRAPINNVSPLFGHTLFGSGKDITVYICKMLYSIQIGLTFFLTLATASLGALVHHDHSFQPDHILRVTAENHTVACATRYSVLVNGSSPGPELRLKEGQVNWVRVYNDMKDENTTIVSKEIFINLILTLSLTIMKALARSHCIYCSLLWWHPSGKPVAYSRWSLLRLRSQTWSWYCRDLFLPFPCWLPSRHCKRPTYRSIRRTPTVQLWWGAYHSAIRLLQWDWQRDYRWFNV